VLLRPLAAWYVGVDWIDGPNVDIVSVFHRADLEPESFDTVVSSTALEHDAYHDETIAKIDEVLRPGGALFICWAGARFAPHARPSDSSGQGKYYQRPAEQTVREIQRCGFLVDTFMYNQSLRRPPYKMNPKDDLKKQSGLCFLIAFKPTRIDEFVKEDRVK
jgi:SAM-dependent methyltransferase